jgi:hypothetical protein
MASVNRIIKHLFECPNCKFRSLFITKFFKDSECLEQRNYFHNIVLEICEIEENRGKITDVYLAEQATKINKAFEDSLKVKKHLKVVCLNWFEADSACVESNLCVSFKAKSKVFLENLMNPLVSYQLNILVILNTLLTVENKKLTKCGETEIDELRDSFRWKMCKLSRKACLFFTAMDTANTRTDSLKEFENVYLQPEERAIIAMDTDVKPS